MRVKIVLPLALLIGCSDPAEQSKMIENNKMIDYALKCVAAATPSKNPTPEQLKYATDPEAMAELQKACLESYRRAQE